MHLNISLYNIVENKFFIIILRVRTRIIIFLAWFVSKYYRNIFLIPVVELAFKLSLLLFVNSFRKIFKIILL